MWILGVVIAFIAIIYAAVRVHNQVHLDEDIMALNEELHQKNKKLQIDFKNLAGNIDMLQKRNDDLYSQYNHLVEDNNREQMRLEATQKSIKEVLNNQTELSKKAYENYWEVLDNKYKEVEKEYEDSKNKLEESYNNYQSKILKDIEKCQQELDKIHSTRDAAIQAQLRENEVKEKLSFYCLTPTESELDDVRKLERIKPDLHNPRILSMLIWSTYFQKPMTALCNNVLGTNTVTGIYKITNQKNGMVYIGQAVDMAKRWKDHAKCGLDIDTPAANKLYKSMKEDGIWNFSWELLEKCPSADLNSKEKYYINLYKSYEYGFNSNAGINK